MSRLVEQQAATIARLQARIEHLEKLLYTPEIRDFLEGVRREAAHQRLKWEEEHDMQKAPADWHWLLSHLSGKALFHAAHIGHWPTMAQVNAYHREKYLHHIVTTAAACYNWHQFAAKNHGKPSEP